MCTTKSQISAQPCLLLLLFFLCTTTNVHCWQSALAPLARLKSKLRISPRTRNISRDRGSSGGGLFGQEASFPISSSSSSSSSRRNKGSSLYDSPTNGDKNHENGKERSNMGKRERIRHKVSNMWSNGRLKQSLSLDRNNGKAAAVEMATTPNKEELLEEMETENKLLRETIRQLEIENDRLHSQQRVVLESFEGDTFFFRSAEKEKQQQREYNFDGEGVGDQMMMDWGITLTEAEMSGDFKSIEDEEAAQWCDEVEDEACPVEPSISFGEALRDRAYWLVGLLAMQSCSGLILSRNEALLANHPIIIYFLTMLVGAGGNAGNQASVRVIRGIALGTLNEKTQGQFLSREVKMAVALSSILSLAGFLRAAAFRTPFPETIAVTASLMLIVFSSICLGAVLPLILQRIGVDPAHSSTTIQVVMDILGVLLAVAISGLILDSPLGVLIVNKLGG